jgi:hypothetical protein
MAPRLTAMELAYATKFVSSIGSGREPLRPVWAASLLLAVSGLMLGGYATILFLSNPTDRVAKLVLLPGGVAGFLLVLVGVGLVRYAVRVAERQRIVPILQKLLAGESVSRTN